MDARAAGLTEPRRATDPAPVHRRLLRTLAVALVAALVAATCADGPDASELVDGPGSDATTDTDESPSPDPFDDGTPLPTDDDYRIGTLDNGLTYLLRSNDKPGGSLDLRLVVDAGSRQQERPDDGSAHFLEHMLFNGTEAFPGNELTNQLQRLGVRFGADVNAYTSYDETVYVLGATTDDPVTVDLAFDVLAEWAARATIDPAQVASEVGVIRDELRQSRETVDGFTFARLEEIYTAGTPYEGRAVIGTADLVEATEADALRRYYETWYRPDNMAVVVVGDLPLDDMEREIRTRFAELTNPATPLVREEVEVALDPAPVTDVIIHPDTAVPSISLDIPLPVRDTGTLEGERMALLETAVATMLTSRLGAAFQRGDLDLDDEPFVSAFAINRGLRYLGTNLRGPDLEAALDGFMGHLLAAATDGFTTDDVTRVQAVMSAALDDELAALNSTQDWHFAEELTTHFLAGGPVDDATRRIERRRGIVDSLTADELTGFWRSLLDSSGPLVVSIGDDASTVPSPARLLEVLDGARPAPRTETTGTIDALMAPPAAADVRAETTHSTPYGDVTEWTFENGVVVSHQETKIIEGAFFVSMESTGGWSSLTTPDASLAVVAVDAVLRSGVGPHDPAALERYEETRSIEVGAWIDEWSETIRASAATSDAEDLFALLHLLTTEPRVDDVALRSVGRAAEADLDRAVTDPDLRADELLTLLLNGGDDRYPRLHREEEISALDAETLLAVFEERFGSVDDLHVAIVGDLAAAEAHDLSARYLGSLPRGPSDLWVDLGTELPSTAVREEVVLAAGTADGGLHRVDWVLGQPVARDEVAGALLSTVISNRLTDTVREELGASYGRAVSIHADREGPGALVSSIVIDGDPARLDEIRAALDDILADLTADGPTRDEFDRALAVTATDYGFVDNGLFLAENLTRSRFPGVDALRAEDRGRMLEASAPDDLRSLAADLYGDAASVEVAKVLP